MFRKIIIVVECVDGWSFSRYAYANNDSDGDCSDNRSATSAGGGCDTDTKMKKKRSSPKRGLDTLFESAPKRVMR